MTGFIYVILLLDVYAIEIEESFVNYDQGVFIFQSAVGFEHQSELSKHGSQTDAAKGFGGKFGVQKDRVDKVRK